MELMWEAGPDCVLAKHVKDLNKGLSSGSIAEDEYFLMTLSVFGHYDTRDFFPDQIEHFRLNQPGLHKKLLNVYQSYFAGEENTGQNLVNDVSNTPTEDKELEIAIALSLADSQNKNEARILINNGIHTEWTGPKAQDKENQKINARKSKQARPVEFRMQSEKVRSTPSRTPSKPMSFASMAQNWANTSSQQATTSLVASRRSESHNQCLNTYDKAFPEQECLNNTPVSAWNNMDENTHNKLLPINGAQNSVSASQHDLSATAKKKRKHKKGNSRTLGPGREIHKRPVLYWLRRDIRSYDNPALVAAVQCDAPVIPVFLWSEVEEGPLAAGGATKVWLHEALKRLDQDLKNKYGSRIVFIKTSSCCKALAQLVQDTGSRTVVWTHMYEPYLKHRDDGISKELEKRHVEVKKFHSYLLNEPGSIRTESIGMRGVGSVQHFMALVRHSDTDAIGQPVDAPPVIPAPGSWPAGNLDDLGLARMPRRKDGTIIDWAAQMRADWDFSEDAAHEAMDLFISDGIRRYEKESSRGDQLNTAKISPYLHFGQISPRAVLQAAMNRKSPKFRRKLAWRDMSYWLLSVFPHLNSKSIRPHYEHQRWSRNKAHLKAWQRGNTGYPLVDAAMRQLWVTGWNNNYMRHVVASFLISYLHIHWIEGYNWFQDTLLDADVAINAMMWQNGGMSGLDQWNFVMHPVDAAMTCDPKGDYIRAWVPELAKLADEHIHTPWKCPPSILRRAGVQLGVNYPHRIITDLEGAREQSLKDVVDLRRKYGKEWVEGFTGNDLIPLPNGRKVPTITRREFKYKTSNPDARDNPHSAVLKGYRSRKRDEAVAFAIKTDFLASTMNECVLRQERSDKAAYIDML